MTTTIKKTIPIKVTAENGDSVVYTLTIYKEDALTQLESVLVDGIEAVQLNNNTYKAVVAVDSDSCVVQAISLYSKADVKINNFASEVNITTRTVATVGTQTIVKIYVTAMELEREYTLVIDKEGTEDVLGLFAVTVNGVEITPVGNIYDAYISDATDSVDVTAITISDVDKVAIGNNSADIHTTTKTIDITDEITTCIITVTDPNDDTNKKEFILNIRKPSSDTTLKSIVVGNAEFSRQAIREDGTNNYIVYVSDKYEKVDVIATANYDLTNISINAKDYEQHISTRQVSIGNNPETVMVVAKAQDGTTQIYTLIIYLENSNTNLEKVTVDGNQATKSKTEENTYEYTLDRITDVVNVGAITEFAQSTVRINTFEPEVHATYQDVDFEGKSIIVQIQVTALDGSIEDYKLIIYALPDNVKLSSVQVNGVEAENVPVNSYEAKVNKNDTSFVVYVIPEDPKASVQINGNNAVQGTASITVNKQNVEEKVNIKVIAQDGTTQDYTLTVKNKSDDCILAVLKVDGEIIEPDENGVYSVDKKFLTESVNVEAIANSSYAYVSINESEQKLQQQTSKVEVPNEVNYITIKIVAEDGTTAEYQLIVNKLSNNTQAEIYIKDDADAWQLITLDEKGNATVKIGTKDNVDLKIVANDDLALVNIAGNIDEYKEQTSQINTLDEHYTKFMKLFKCIQDNLHSVNKSSSIQT